MELNEIMEPFVHGTIEMLGLMAGVEACRGSAEPGEFDRGYRGIIKLDGNAWGELSIYLSGNTAGKIVASLLGDETDNPGSSTVLDGVGEMVNIISGYAKGALAGTPYHFFMSFPEVQRLKGAPPEERLLNATVIESELGSLAVSLLVETGVSAFEVEP